MNEKILSTDRHTPGPWSVEDPMSFELAIVEAGKAPADWGFIACLPFKDEDDPQDIDFPREVVHANARLIAAAPDLLALAEQYASECASCNGEGYVLHMGTCERCDCPDCADIRAVIAKAGGKLPNDDREPPEPDGECYRGNEWANAQAHESARIQRELKR